MRPYDPEKPETEKEVGIGHLLGAIRIQQGHKTQNMQKVSVNFGQFV